MNDPKFHYLGNKAGVLNADSIQKKVQEITKGSAYYQQQEKKRQLYVQKIERMKMQLQQYQSNVQNVEQTKKEVDEYINKLENNQQRYWAHFDMDMFYIACELLDKPDLRDKPCAVGGMSMLSTANYVARKYGIRSAMPGFVAKQLCPELIILSHNFEKYKNVSNIFLGILKKVDPELESMGLDEANLDITNQVEGKSKEEIIDFCDNLRKQINEATNLTASCGIGCNKMLAKIASEQKKPNGIFMIENAFEFMKNVPIRKIPGIGNVMEQLLNGLEIQNCDQIREKADQIFTLFSHRQFEFLVQSAYGIGRTVHELPDDPHSFSTQRTFSSTDDLIFLENKLEEFSQQLADDLNQSSQLSKQVSIQLKTSKFEVRSKQMATNEYINTAQQIFSYAKLILKQLLPIEPLRLIGLKVSSLITEADFKRNSLDTFLAQKNQENSISSNSLKFSKSDHIQDVVVCPICEQQIKCDGFISKLNKHMDACLNQGCTQINQPQNLKQDQKIDKKNSQSKKGKREIKVNNSKKLDSFFNKK